MIETSGLLLLGVVCGALLNYLADVLPVARALAAPACPVCGRRCSLREYAAFFRACPGCRAGRRLRWWVVLGAAPLAVLWIHQNARPELGFWLTLTLLGYFGLVMIVDIEHRLILNLTSLPGAVLALLCGTLLRDLRAALLGGAAGFLIMLAVYTLGRWLGQLLQRWRAVSPTAEPLSAAQPIEPLGFGDVTLAGIVGLLLGWPGILPGIALTILLAAAGSLLYLLVRLLLRRKYEAGLSIPYGPFLVLSAVLLLFYSKQILALIYA